MFELQLFVYFGKGGEVENCDISLCSSRWVVGESSELNTAFNNYKGKSFFKGLLYFKHLHIHLAIIYNDGTTFKLE